MKCTLIGRSPGAPGAALIGWDACERVRDDGVYVDWCVCVYVFLQNDR